MVKIVCGNNAYRWNICRLCILGIRGFGSLIYRFGCLICGFSSPFRWLGHFTDELGQLFGWFGCLIVEFVYLFREFGCLFLELDYFFGDFDYLITGFGTLFF